MYIAPRQPPGDTILMSTERTSLYAFVASFKEISSKSDFIQFFHDLIHVSSPGAWCIQSQGVKVLISTETACHFGHLLLVSNDR